MVYIAGFAELVGAWLTGEVDLSADQLTATASDLFHSLSRRLQQQNLDPSAQTRWIWPN